MVASLTNEKFDYQAHSDENVIKARLLHPSQILTLEGATQPPAAMLPHESLMLQSRARLGVLN